MAYFKLVIGLLALGLILYDARKNKSVGDLGWALLCVLWIFFP